MTRSIAPALALVLVFTACDPGVGDGGSIARTPRPRPGRPAEPPLKIALVGTMSGPEGWRGEDAFEGADIGVHHLNRRTGRGDRPFELEVLDDRGDAARSLELIGNLVERGDTVGIVFAGPPRVLVDAEDLLRRARTPAILCFGDLYGARELSSHLFQATPPYTWQARDLARYVARDRAYEEVGLLTSAGTHDGSLAAEAVSNELETYGIDRIVRANYRENLTGPLRRLQRKQVEAIVVQGRPSTLERIYGEIRALGARYRNTRAARVASLPNKRLRRSRQRTGWWRPQLIGFDGMINDRMEPPPPGSIAAATYARGAHFLPLPSLERFRGAFKDWWDSSPLGFELRAYDATMAVGWAAERAGRDGDIAGALEEMRARRFGGLPITLGPDDHLMVEEVTIGLWTVPFPDDGTRSDPPKELPWVPLARGFSIDGKTTDIPSADWSSLFRNPPPRGGPAPRFQKMRFGVTTPRSDPLR